MYHMQCTAMITRISWRCIFTRSIRSVGRVVYLADLRADLDAERTFPSEGDRHNVSSVGDYDTETRRAPGVVSVISCSRRNGKFVIPRRCRVRHDIAVTVIVEREYVIPARRRSPIGLYRAVVAERKERLFELCAFYELAGIGSFERAPRTRAQPDGVGYAFAEEARKYSLSMEILRMDRHCSFNRRVSAA